MVYLLNEKKTLLEICIILFAPLALSSTTPTPTPTPTPPHTPTHTPHIHLMMQEFQLLQNV